MNGLAQKELLGDWEINSGPRRSTSHETVGHRRLVGTARAVAAAPTPTPLPLPPAQAAGPPEDPHRHPVRPQDRHRLGGPARRTRLWLRQDLPGAPEALARGRRLDRVARGAAGRTQRGRPDRLAAGLDWPPPPAGPPGRGGEHAR